MQSVCLETTVIGHIAGRLHPVASVLNRGWHRQSAEHRFSRWPRQLWPTVGATRYVRNQEEHHRTRSYQDEFRSLLNQYKIPFDENQLWD